MRLIKMKTKMKMENRSHRYDKDRRKSRHEHKYGKYKKCLSMMMLLKKSVAYKKKRVISNKNL